ncbi:MAG: beta-galactosidase [Candidatus Nealsonbacteria bacterium]|nr:beta-galactosidase [Candidatus Nealsonbacteria bacterium]
MIIFGILNIILLFAGYLSIGTVKPAADISWGVNFSQKHAKYLGLDWQGTYLALLDELGVKKIKILTFWDLIEQKEGKYDFGDLDWQIEQAQKRGINVLLVVGVKTGRWPECHEPEWIRVQNQSASWRIKSRNFLLEYLEKIINRYKDNKTIWAWQVENEPFFPFGECSIRLDKNFLKKETELIKSLDPTRPAIISDSGEFSFWIKAAKLGDMVSTTLHRKVLFGEIKAYITYPLRPIFYWRRAQIIKKFFGKEVFVGELQAEPWCPQGIADCLPEEQKKTMSLEQFQKNVRFARDTGLKEIYFWGAEWWYWMKEKQNQLEIWEEAKKLFQ